MNQSKLRISLLSGFLGVGMLMSQGAPAQGGGPAKNVSMTRPMAIFLQLERGLANAISKHDQGSTDAMLAAGFELRLADNPTEPTVRADWLKLPSSGVAGEIEQLTVHDHGALSIVSFIRTTPAIAQDSMNDRSYIVDVWQKRGDGWQLLTRYQSTLPAEPAQQEDVAPTGKG